MHTSVLRAATDLLAAIAGVAASVSADAAAGPAASRPPPGPPGPPDPLDLLASTAALDGDWVILVLPQGLAQVVAVWACLVGCKGYVPVAADTQLPRLRRLFAETRPVACIGEVGASPIAGCAVLSQPVYFVPHFW